MFVERWDTAAGFRVHSCADPEPGEKPPLVLVHGLGVSTRYLLPTGERLLPDFAVYGPNLPGFGPSGKPARPLPLQELAFVLGAWLDAVDVEQPILLANSFGCQTAVELVLQRPDRLNRLVLVGPTVDRHARSISRQLFGLARDGLSEPAALNAIVVRDYLRAGPLRVWRTGQEALADRIEDKLPEIELPVLIVIGERDGFVSERWARELAARTPHGRLEIVPGAAHAVNFNSPDALAALVREFASRGTRATPR
jgi:2-hydroxy-6-oxonona-2,4-dienedioate hydrolase